MRGEAGRASLWHLPARARPAVHGHGLRIAADVPLVCSETCSVTMDTLTVVRNRCAKFEHFGMLCEPKGSPFWALGSVLAGSEARGTCLIPSGCSVADLARTTCDTARAGVRARATRFQREHVRSTSSGPRGQPLWQGALGSTADDPCCCAGLPGPLTGRGRGIASVKSVARSRLRSQRVAIQTLPLLRGWQPRCVRYAQSQRSCTRGGARGGRRARLNLMRPCRLGASRPEISGTTYIQRADERNQTHTASRE